MKSLNLRCNSTNYDIASGNYDACRKAGSSSVQILIDLMGHLESKNILEIACGTANYMLSVKELPRRIIGLDLSMGMLKQAQSKYHSAALTRGDAVTLPFRDNTFDAAYSILATHHIPDKNRFLAEAYRVLKNGSPFIIQFCAHNHFQTYCFYHYFPRGLEIDKARFPDKDMFY